MTEWPIHARISGPVVMIGFGSIGKGTLPLIERHFAYDKSRFVVIDPEDKDRKLLDERGIRFIHQAVTRDNYRKLLRPLLTEGGGQGFCVNLSVDTSSLDIMEFCREIGALYIDTVVEPWTGFYFDSKLGPEKRSNYALRGDRPGGAAQEARRHHGRVVLRRQSRHGVLVRQAGAPQRRRRSQAQVQGAADPRGVGPAGQKGRRQGHSHRRARYPARQATPKPLEVFVNTWSVEGFLSEGMQPAELGWGTHEKRLPKNGFKHKVGCQAAIYLTQPGANTRVRSWTPTAKAQYGFLVTHNESISIADYFTLRDGRKVVYRPTCHYAYHPCNDAVLSLHELFGQAGSRQPANPHFGRARDRRRHRRARRAALRPQEERLLVRLAAFDRRDALDRALSERDRPAGDLGGARRHGLGAGKSKRRYCRGRRDGFSPLPAKCRCPISVR